MLKYELLMVPATLRAFEIEAHVVDISRGYIQKPDRNMIERATPNDFDASYRLRFTPIAALNNYMLSTYHQCNLFTRIITKSLEQPAINTIDIYMAQMFEKLRAGLCTWEEAFAGFYATLRPGMRNTVKQELKRSQRLIAKCYVCNIRIGDGWGLISMLRSYCRDILDMPDIIIDDYLQYKTSLSYDSISGRRIRPEISFFTKPFEEVDYTVLHRWRSSKKLKFKPSTGERDPDNVSVIAREYAKCFKDIIQLTAKGQDTGVSDVKAFVDRGWSHQQMIQEGYAFVSYDPEKFNFIIDYVSDLKWGERRKALLDYAHEHHVLELLEQLVPYPVRKTEIKQSF